MGFILVTVSAENPEFCERIIKTGATFIGPSARWIKAMGHKTEARELMIEHGMHVGTGSGLLTEDSVMIEEAKRIGYPVLIKPAAGGVVSACCQHTMRLNC